jgi:hypothetical protein
MLSGSTKGIFLYMGIVLFLNWLFIAALINRLALSKALFTKLTMLFWIYWIYLGVVGVIGGQYMYTLKQLGSAQLMFSPYFIYKYYSYRKLNLRLKKIAIISFYIFIFFSVRAILFYTANPEVARQLARGEYAIDVAIGGGYVLAYAAGVMICYLLNVSFILKNEINKKIKRNRFFCLIVCVVLFILVIQTTSTITLIATVIGCFVATFFGVSKKQKSIAVMNTVFLAALIVVDIAFRREIGIWFMNLFSDSNSTLSIRLQSVGVAIAYGNGSSDSSYLFGRLSIPLKSFTTFLHNPIFGVAWKYGNVYVLGPLYGVGCHCEIADILAKYGIFFGGCIIAFYVIHFKKVQKMGRGTISFGWIVCLLIMAMFNPFLSFQTNFIIMFAIPVFTNELSLLSLKGDK